jgi:hypothetical protein
MTYLLKFKTENAEAKALLEYLQKSNIVEFIEPTDNINLVSNQTVKDLSIQERIERVKKTFGTIKSNVTISNEMLRRENLYDDESR